jgi:hypothetical protein
MGLESTLCNLDSMFLRPPSLSHLVRKAEPPRWSSPRRDENRSFRARMQVTTDDSSPWTSRMDG